MEASDAQDFLGPVGVPDGAQGMVTSLEPAVGKGGWNFIQRHATAVILIRKLMRGRSATN